MPRAKQRTPELRDRVLASAAVLLAREGAGGFTARRIASEAATSPPAVYELFGDKAGLLRALFFDGFRQLATRLDALDVTDDPRTDLLALAEEYRRFMQEHPVLAELMFLRPFADFDPGESELAAGASVRELVIARVQRAIDAGLLRGDALDIGHVLVSLVQGLVVAERSGRLGGSRTSTDRRWRLALKAMLDGCSPRQGASAA